MPTYDYVCEACEHAFELFQSIKDEPKKQCPKCGKKKLRRLIGPGAAIVFKGSGFYTTDYRSDSYKKAAAADKPAALGATSRPKSRGEKSSSEKSSTEKSRAARSRGIPRSTRKRLKSTKGS